MGGALLASAGDPASDPAQARLLAALVANMFKPHVGGGSNALGGTQLKCLIAECEVIALPRRPALCCANLTRYPLRRLVL